MIYHTEPNRVLRPALRRGGRFVLARARRDRLVRDEAEAARLIREEGFSIRVESPRDPHGVVVRRSLSRDDDVLTTPAGAVPLPGAPC